MLNKLLNRRANNEKVNRFNKIIEFAKSVIEETKKGQKGNNSVPLTHPLVDVIRLLGRDLQTRYLSRLLFEDEESSLPHPFPESIFFGGGEGSEEGLYNLRSATGKTLDYFKVPAKTARNIHFGRDLVLPWPWQRKRLINTI